MAAVGFICASLIFRALRNATVTVEFHAPFQLPPLTNIPAFYFPTTMLLCPTFVCVCPHYKLGLLPPRQAGQLNPSTPHLPSPSTLIRHLCPSTWPTTPLHHAPRFPPLYLPSLGLPFPLLSRARKATFSSSPLPYKLALFPPIGFPTLLSEMYPRWAPDLQGSLPKSHASFSPMAYILVSHYSSIVLVIVEVAP